MTGLGQYSAKDHTDLLLSPL